jgi:hypothetical protein
MVTVCYPFSPLPLFHGVVKFNFSMKIFLLNKAHIHYLQYNSHDPPQPLLHEAIKPVFCIWKHAQQPQVALMNLMRICLGFLVHLSAGSDCIEVSFVLINFPPLLVFHNSAARSALILGWPPIARLTGPGPATSSRPANQSSATCPLVPWTGRRSSLPSPTWHGSPGPFIKSFDFLSSNRIFILKG